jgi:hemerythrin
MEKSEENIEFITWKREYDTGIVLIDKQNRSLVDLMNNLFRAHHHKHEKEVLRETVLKLVEYTKLHFTFEEKHMAESAYTKFEEHVAMHKVFVKEMIDVLNNLKKGDFENLTLHILEFMKNWLTQHILVQDRDYGNYYKVKKRYS